MCNGTATGRSAAKRSGALLLARCWSGFPPDVGPPNAMGPRAPEIRSRTRGVEPAYIWGDALAECERIAPAARLVNLETSITRSDHYYRGKDIHYRMHPENIGCVTAARFDVCALANNHALDYGDEGLIETLQTLKAAGVMTVGAGRNLEEARRPSLDPATGRLETLRMTPLRIRRLRLSFASTTDARCLCDILNRVNHSFGLRADLMSDAR